MRRMILDTEAAGTLDAPMVYDIGFIITDDLTPILEKRYIVKDVYYGMPDLMNSAHYASKLPQYDEMIMQGDLTVMSLDLIIRNINVLCERYNVHEVWAFNASYDDRALRHTVAAILGTSHAPIIPSNVSWHCIHALACATLLNRPKFYRYAIINNLITPKGTPRSTAEVCYRYITGDNQFTEAHTALDDARIELTILAAIKRRHCKCKGLDGLHHNPTYVLRKGYQAYIH